MTEPPPVPPRRGWLRVLTGTRPGLERFLLGVFPAIVVGAAVGFAAGAWAGLAAGAVVLAGVCVFARGVGD